MKATINADVFKKLISNAKKFTAGYIFGNNIAMQYISLKVDAEEKTIEAVALDGHKLSVEKAPILDADSSFKCLIKPNIPKIVKDDLLVELELEGDAAYVTVSDNIIGYRQPQVEYYQYETIKKNAIEAETRASICANPRLLKDALSGTEILFGSKHVKIEIKDKFILIWYGSGEEKENLKMVLPMGK